MQNAAIPCRYTTYNLHLAYYSVAVVTAGALKQEAQTCPEKEARLEQEFKMLLGKVECLTVDSASDELLAGQLMLSTAQPDDSLAPNLKLVMLDVTHASRRTHCCQDTESTVLAVMLRGEAFVR